MPTLDRRQLLGAGLASLATLGVAACGGTDSGSAAGGATKGWAFTDDLGEKLTADKTPVRIAGFGDQAAALWNFGIEPVAMFTYSDPAEDAMYEGLDLDKTELVGTAYGEIDLEKLAAAKPDLIVTTAYTSNSRDDMFGFKDKAQIEKVRKIAPIANIMQKGSALDVIKRNEQLAKSLGADIGSGRIAADKAAFEKASAALSAAARSGLTVLPVYGEDANVYYAKAPDDPALTLYSDLGVKFVPVGGDDYYWEVLSWEKADKYSPDLVLYSLRDSYSPEQYEKQAVFNRLPVVQAGQMHPWKFKSMDYRAQAAYLTELAGWLSSDKQVSA